MFFIIPEMKWVIVTNVNGRFVPRDFTNFGKSRVVEVSYGV